MSLFDRISKEEHDKEVAGLRSQIRERENNMADLFTQFLLEKLRAHSPQLVQHSERVGKIVKEMLELKVGLRKNLIDCAYRAALLHDYGKLALSKELVCESSQSTFDHIDSKVLEHPDLGVFFISTEANRYSEVLKGIACEGIKHHHERVDGSGYSEKLTGIDIPFEAKLISIADAFDHLTIGINESRFSITQAFEIIAELSGTVYDPAVVRLLKNYVAKHISIADRSDVGGATLAVESGLNEYVRQVQDLIRNNDEMNAVHKRLTLSETDEKTKEKIVNYLTGEIVKSLPLPERCCRNIVLKLSKMPLMEDIVREDVDFDDDSYNSLIEDYEGSLKGIEKQVVGLRHHVEILLPIKNMNKIQDLSIVSFKPQRTYDKNYVFADLWYPMLIEDSGESYVWLWR